MAPRGRLLAEVLTDRTRNEIGGNERLAWRRIAQDITTGLVTLTAETASGDPFELPPGCTWENAHYSPRKSTASWWIGPKPVKANPLAGKVQPVNTRVLVTAYCVRRQDAAPAATLSAVQTDQTLSAIAVRAAAGKKMGRPSPRLLVRVEAERQIREELDTIPGTLKEWGIKLADWLAQQHGEPTVTGPVVETYLRDLHRVAKSLKLLKSGK
jgi:hypothetical protein